HSAYLNLSLTRDTYYAQNRLADFEIMVERAPETAVFKLERLPGVRQVRKRIVEDVNVDIEGVNEPRVGRLISMPALRSPVINDIVILSGRYFEAGEQRVAVVSNQLAESNGLALGDRFQISVDSKKYSLRVVGLAASPEYVYMIRNVQALIPSPERFGILWVPEEFAETALDMKSACNNIVGLVDNPEDLDKILDEADKVLDPYGIFAKTKREDQLSNRFISDEIKGLGVSAKIIPTLFLGIAALILLILLNRMVRTERTQIGLMKAFGYSNWAVGFHYIEYGLILCVIGCVGGFALGQWMAGGMMKLYVQFYQFPILESRIYLDVLARSMGITLVFATLGALSAAIQAARIQPAESMRAEAPSRVNRVWLEYIPVLWKRVSFTWKMILRNISRNRFRSAVNCFGVAISLSLLLMGFFMTDSIDFGMKFQFRDAQREDVKVSFQREQGRDVLYEASRFPHVRRAEGLLEYPFEIRSVWRKKDIVVIGIEKGSEMRKVMNFARETFSLGDGGLVLAESLAEELQVGPGDTVTLEPLMGRIEGEFEVPVRAVAQQFLGTAAYMDHAALSRMLDESYVINSALLRLESGSRDAINKTLKEIGGIAAVTFNDDAYQSIQDTLGKSMVITNTVLLIFAGVIAFSIIYNITAVSLSERQRELASLRVLGLSTQEVGGIVYFENMLMGALGLLFGVPMGMGICALLVEAYSNDMFRLPFYIDRSTYVISILLTYSFVLLANLAVRRKIQNLDLVEVLKERE
ncbi:MAG: FtsX-like permease family protein, partial [Candidatus Hydrogenedentes bacterium]|nr:FtsX-like permease family protein [Candidatus Hydrogenedentota bacterium]